MEVHGIVFERVNERKQVKKSVINKLRDMKEILLFFMMMFATGNSKNST